MEGLSLFVAGQSQSSWRVAKVAAPLSVIAFALSVIALIAAQWGIAGAPPIPALLPTSIGSTITLGLITASTIAWLRLKQAGTEGRLGIKYATPELKRDPNYVLKAIRNDPSSIQFADRTLLANADFMLQAARVNLSTIPFADRSLREDKRFILNVVFQNKEAFRQAPEDLVADLVSICPRTLEYASDKHRGNKWIVHMAIGQEGTALAYATTELQDNYWVVWSAIVTRGIAFRNASDRLKDTERLALFANGRDGRCILYTSDRLRKSRDFAKSAVAENGHALRGLENFQDDDEIVELAVKSAPDAIMYASSRLRRMRSFRQGSTRSPTPLRVGIALTRGAQSPDKAIQQATDTNLTATQRTALRLKLQRRASEPSLT